MREMLIKCVGFLGIWGVKWWWLEGNSGAEIIRESLNMKNMIEDICLNVKHS